MKHRIAALLSAAAVFNIAVPAEVSAEELPLICINAGYGAENEITEVLLNIRAENGISAYSIEVDYDPRTINFIDAKQGSEFSGGTFYCNGNYSDNAVRLVWSDSRNKKGDGTAAVLRFRPAYGTAETQTPLSIGYSVLADDLKEAEFEKSDDVLKILKKIKKGDVNCDNDVSVSDIVCLNAHLINADESLLSDNALANAEVDGDKLITSADSTLITNYVAMIIKEL